MDKIRPASRDELAKLTAAMPEPYQPMILLASWCALRFGGLTELRRRDIDLEERVIRDGKGGPNSRIQRDAAIIITLPPKRQHAVTKAISEATLYR